MNGRSLGTLDPEELMAEIKVLKKRKNEKDRQNQENEKKYMSLLNNHAKLKNIVKKQELIEQELKNKIKCQETSNKEQQKLISEQALRINEYKNIIERQKIKNEVLINENFGLKEKLKKAEVQIKNGLISSTMGHILVNLKYYIINL